MGIAGFFAKEKVFTRAVVWTLAITSLVNHAAGIEHGSAPPSPPSEAALPSKVSSDKNCYRSLEPQDLEVLGGIVGLRDQLAVEGKKSAEEIYKVVSAKIDAQYRGDKRDAAYAVLASSVAANKDALLWQVINRSFGKGETELAPNEIATLQPLIKEAEQHGLDLKTAINVKLQALQAPFKALQSAGARLDAQGNWDFNSFDFGFAQKDPELKGALEAFFPDQMHEFSYEARGYARFGNRVVTQVPAKKRTSAAEKTDWVWKSSDAEEHMKKTAEIMDHFQADTEEYLRSSQEENHWTTLAWGGIKGLFGGSGVSFDKQTKAHQKMIEGPSELQLHGATEETLAQMRQVTWQARDRSSELMEKGLSGMKKAYTAIALSPALVIGAPAIIGGAGAIGTATTTTGAVLAGTSTVLVAAAITIPMAVAARDVMKSVREGNGTLCSLVKHGSAAGVSLVETLEWGALGPVLGKLAPAVAPGLQGATRLLSGGKLILSSQAATQLATIVPGAALSGLGLYGGAAGYLSNTEAIDQIQKALSEETARNPKSPRVEHLKEMLANAKVGRWENVVAIAQSSIGLLGSIQATRDALKPATPVASKETLPTQEPGPEELVALESKQRIIDKVEARASRLDDVQPAEAQKMRELAAALKAGTRQTPGQDLSLEQRTKLSEVALGLPEGQKLSKTQQDAIMAAHQIDNLADKAKILEKGAQLNSKNDVFNVDQRRKLIESFAAGNVPSQSLDGIQADRLRRLDEIVRNLDKPDPHAKLPEPMELSLKRKDIAKYFDLYGESWKKDFHPERLEKIFASVESGKPLTPEQKIELNTARRELKALRFAFVALDKSHELPPAINRLAVAEGHMQDAEKNGHPDQVKKIAGELRSLVKKSNIREIHNEVDNFDPAGRKSFREWMGSEVGNLRDGIKSDELSAKEFHDMRKSIGKILTVMNALRATNPDPQMDQLGDSLNRVYQDMGNQHDTFVTGRLNGTLDYRHDPIKIKPEIRRQLEDAILWFRQSEKLN